MQEQNSNNLRDNTFDVLDSQLSPQDLIRLVQAGLIDIPQYESLLVSSGIAPSKSNWRDFLEYFLASLGTLFLLSGIIFFFAYNWADISKTQKFLALQSGILLLGAFIFWKGIETQTGKLTVIALAAMSGVLMAVFGQIYQTGADPYELFILWAVVIFPLAIVTRSPALWIIWLIIANIAVSLYVEQGFGEGYSTNVYAKLGFILNGIFLLAWEILAFKRFQWMQGAITHRVVFIICLLFSTMLMVDTIYYINASQLSATDNILNLGIYLLTMTVSYFYYQERKHDLLIATFTLLSLGALPLTWVSKHIGFFNLDMILLFGTITVAESIFSVIWLRRKQLQWSSKS